MMTNHKKAWIFAKMPKCPKGRSCDECGKVVNSDSFRQTSYGSEDNQTFLCEKCSSSADGLAFHWESV